MLHINSLHISISHYFFVLVNRPERKNCSLYYPKIQFAVVGLCWNGELGGGESSECKWDVVEFALFYIFFAWTEKKETRRRLNGVREGQYGEKIENSVWKKFLYEGIACAWAWARVYGLLCCASANVWVDGFSDGRFPQWELSWRKDFEALIRIRFVRFGISVCRIARCHSHSCITIRGQLIRLLIASSNWKKTKTPDRAERGRSLCAACLEDRGILLYNF